MPGIWTTDVLKQRLPQIVTPYSESSISTSAYELHVGGEAFVSGDDSEKILPKEGETIAIPPGQVALLITDEILTVPTDALGLLSIKFGVKAKGLINVSGFHVDPGFTGKLIFSVYNAGTLTIHISRGSPLFLIWFCALHGTTLEPYAGTHKGQMHIPDGAITNLATRLPSPMTLEKDIDALRSELANHRTVLGVAVTILLAVFGLQIRQCDNRKPETTSGESVKLSIPAGASIRVDEPKSDAKVELLQKPNQAVPPQESKSEAASQRAGNTVPPAPSGGPFTPPR